MSADLPAGLREAVARAVGEEVSAAARIGGGDINEAWRVELADGRPAFLKSRRDAPEGEYATEAAGLRWLEAVGGVDVPEVLAAGDAFLLLGWVEAGRLDERGEEELGRGLAVIHRAGAERFGALPPEAPAGVAQVGGIPLDEGGEPARDDSGFAPVYAARLLGLAARASDRGALGGGGLAIVESVCARMDDLAGPAEPPARTHGDLWSGNVLAGPDGRARLIDPAAHGAHRELDLAMLRLFGAPPERVFAAYAEEYPLGPGWQERIGLWQLQPLLIHAILFGGGYGSSVESTARRYG